MYDKKNMKGNCIFSVEKPHCPSSPTKVCQFELSSLVDQQVLGFQVSVENFPAMAIRQTPQQLEKIELQRKKNSGVNDEKLLETLAKQL